MADSEDVASLKLQVQEMAKTIEEQKKLIEHLSRSMEKSKEDFATVYDQRRTKKQKLAKATKDDNIVTPNISNHTPIPTQNFFEALAPNDDENMQTDEEDDVPNDDALIQKLKNIKKSTFIPPPSSQLHSQSADNTKVPPIILREKDKWMFVSKKLSEQKINFGQAKNIAEGIRIYPTTSDDFRKMVKLLQGENLQFHTYSLEEEKNLKIVIRGLPHDISCAIIAENLKEMNFNPSKVVRMTKGPNKTPMPLVLVILPREERKIYDITTLCGLTIKVESLKNSASLGQCFRCQKFGHSQAKCTADYKCVKCAGGHPTYQCPNADSDPPKCANCGGPHPANYGNCPANPRSRQQSQRQQNPQNPWTQEAPSSSSTADFPPLRRKTNDEPEFPPEMMKMFKCFMQFYKSYTNSNTEDSPHNDSRKKKSTK